MLIQKKPLNFITLGPRGTDNINKMITLTEQTCWLANCKKFRPWRSSKNFTCKQNVNTMEAA
jgi:hypothetical protein